jgi:hypothetical protein
METLENQTTGSVTQEQVTKVGEVACLAVVNQRIGLDATSLALSERPGATALIASRDVRLSLERLGYAVPY